MAMVVTAGTDPRDYTRSSWSGHLGALASRGEVDGPRVNQAKRAMAHLDYERALQHGVKLEIHTREEAIAIADRHATKVIAANMREASGAGEGSPAPATVGGQEGEPPALGLSPIAAGAVAP